MCLGQCLAQEAFNKHGPPPPPFFFLHFQSIVLKNNQVHVLRVLGRLWKLTPPKKQYTEMAVPVLSPAPRGSEPGVHGLPQGPVDTIRGV